MAAKRPADMPKLVHVVFKTHLDIGFTDLAARVTENYLQEFIPRAIGTAEELRRRGGKERFVWTTGSWLIHTCLKRGESRTRDALGEAVLRGDIAWHALPFTTHTELMDAALCDYGLSLSAALDARFGKTTRAAKMTDVPGHTIGLVPLLAKRGIAYLHIGVNGGSCLPKTPRLFRWRAGDEAEIIVQYDGNYGETLVLPGIEEALVIVNGSDNQGPPGAETVLGIFADLSKQFPGAELRASTLDAFLPALLEAGDLPALDSEIGDTWIHGIGSDPLKVARFRELLRLRRGWEEQGRLRPGTAAHENFHDELLMIPEHTWGLDVKKYLGDYTHWSGDDFQKARRADRVEPPEDHSEFAPFYRHAQGELENLYPHNPELRRRQSYSFFESSHREQRAYIDAALACLPEDLKTEAAGALENLNPRRPAAGITGTSGAALFPGEAFTLGPWRAIIGDSGALISLREPGGRELAGEGGAGAYSYQTFSHEDYVKYHRDYNRDMARHSHWLIPDFGKPGMQYADPCPRRAFFSAHIQSIRLHRNGGADEAELILRSSANDPRGAPGTLVLRYGADKTRPRLEISLDWFDKEASRLPEALWFSINLSAANPGRWRFSKLGSVIDPLNVIPGGNRACHGIDHAEYREIDARYRITPLDSPLAALGSRKMLRFDNRFEDPAGGIHFNLYNNIWGTNFPLWYEENGRSRFIIDPLS